MGVKKQKGREKIPPLLLLTMAVLREKFLAAEHRQASKAKAEQDHGRRLGDGCWSGAWAGSRAGRLCRCSCDPAVESSTDRPVYLRKNNNSLNPMGLCSGN